MVKKNIKKIILVLIILLFLVLIFLRLKMNEKDPADNLIAPGLVSTEDQANLVDIKEKINSYGDIEYEEYSIQAFETHEEKINLREEASLEAQAREYLPFSGLKGMGLEFMNKEEKENFTIPDYIDAQIIGRNFSGEITAYKLIRNVGDIIYSN